MPRPTDAPDERTLFGCCLDLSPEERRLFLARTCRWRPRLRRRIERLLALHERAERESVAPERPEAGAHSEAPAPDGRAQSL